MAALQGLASTEGASEESQSLVETVQRHEHDQILVLLGFDGVLTEYEDDPEAVRLSSARRQLLRQLMRRPGVTLGVISGRRVHDLRQRVGLGGEVFYIGLHGLEAVGPRFNRIEHESLRQYRERLHDITMAAQPLISEIDGAHLENKELVLALHTRQAGPTDAVWARLHLLRRAGEIADPRTFRMLRGHHVLELLPNLGPTTAAAIAAVRECVEQREERRVFVVYVGEDVPENDAYEATAAHGVSLAVGRRVRQADYHLESIEMVDELLARLAALRGRRSPDAPAPRRTATGVSSPDARWRKCS